MPSVLVPNSASLAEFNPCHNPAGPGGGRFCSKTGAGFSDAKAGSARGGRSKAAIPQKFFDDALMETEAAKKEFLRLRDVLLEMSFKNGPEHETLAVIDMATKKQVDGIAEGGDTSVQMTQDLEDAVASSAMPMSVHTHPTSGPFSSGDFEMLLNEVLDGSNLRQMAVYGKDGSVYHFHYTPRMPNEPMAAAIFYSMSDTAEQAEFWAKEKTRLYLVRELGIDPHSMLATNIDLLDGHARQNGHDPDEYFRNFRQVGGHAYFTSMVKSLRRHYGLSEEELGYAGWIPRGRREWVKRAGRPS